MKLLRLFITINFTKDEKKTIIALWLHLFRGTLQAAQSWLNRLRIQLHCAIYRSNSFVLMLHHCVNLKAIRYESMSLNRIAADKSHGVIVSLTIWFKVVEFSFFKHEVVIAISCKTIDEKIILFENSSRSWRKAYVGTATVLIQQTSLYRVFR